MTLIPEAPLNEAEMQEMREGGAIWQKIKVALEAEVKVGVTGEQLNSKAKELFDLHQVEPAFFNYQDFPGHICVSVNDCIIHGVGNSTPLQAQDKITLDIGFKYKSMYIDSAFTTIVDPSSNEEYSKFIGYGKAALWAAIKKAKEIVESGKPLYNGDIAFTIESYIRSLNNKDLSLIDGFVGHGIGRKLHDKPHIFNKGKKPGEGDLLEANKVFCIEPMLLSQNTGEYKRGKNGFDIVSHKPNAFTCHWEHMVLIKKDSIEVLTASQEELQTYLQV